MCYDRKTRDFMMTTTREYSVVTDGESNFYIYTHIGVCVCVCAAQSFYIVDYHSFCGTRMTFTAALFHSRLSSISQQIINAKPFFFHPSVLYIFARFE